MPPAASLATFTDGFNLTWNFMQEGGYVMILIGACSIMSLAIVIMKALQLRWAILFPKKIVAEIEKIETYATQGDITPLQRVLEEDGSVAAQLGIIAISGKYETREENNEACETAAKGIMHRLENGVPTLEVLVTVSPLLGLLGAVIGLVAVFSGYSSADLADSDSHEVAKGIAEALHATIAGLFVAIPSLLAHGYFSRKLDAISVRMELILRKAIHDFHRHFEVRRTPMKER